MEIKREKMRFRISVELEREDAQSVELGYPRPCHGNNRNHRFHEVREFEIYRWNGLANGFSLPVPSLVRVEYINTRFSSPRYNIHHTGQERHDMNATLSAPSAILVKCVSASVPCATLILNSSRMQAIYTRLHTSCMSYNHSIREF